jgi:hypothetical protein
MPGFVTYTDWYAEIVANACACGFWQEGLAEGLYAWDQSNAVADPIVTEALVRVIACDLGAAYTQSKMRPYIADRRDWTVTFRTRCHKNGLRVHVNGPAATVSSIGASFPDGNSGFKTFAKDNGLDLLPVKFLSLGEVDRIGAVPIFEAEVDQVPLIDRNNKWILCVTQGDMHPQWKPLYRRPKPVYIVGRLDLALKPKPIERVVDTWLKAKNLARRIEAERPRLEKEAADRKAAADEAEAIAFASESRPDDEAAVLEAFG